MKKINEVSRIAGVSKRTLQYYDDEGIISIERTTHNHRVYDQQTLEQIWQILIYKEMGFKLSEIKYLLNLSEEQKEQYIKRQIKRIEDNILIKEIELKFISLVQNGDFPMRPEEGCEKTYMMRIEEMRENIKKKLS